MSRENPLSDLTEYDEEKTLKLASDIATANLLFAEQELGRRILDTSLTTRALLDIAEHSYKVSGMQKKQEPKEQQGRFIFNIHLGDGGDISIAKSLPEDTIDVDPTPMDLVREAATLAHVSFDNAPEFS